MMKTKGVVRGNSIVLLGRPGLPEGAEVEIQLNILKRPRGPQNEDKVDRTLFGIWKRRKDIKDSARWVSKLRDTEWMRR